jgi:hypothetical protein
MAMQKATIGTILGVAAVGVIVTALVTGLLISNQTIPNTGSLKTIGVIVCWDSGFTNATTSVNWGVLEPNSSRSYTVYVKNNGTAAETLSMTTANWSSTIASSYITLSWNRENYILAHGSYVQAILTLSVSPSIANVTSFTFDIIMTGTENT